MKLPQTGGCQCGKIRYEITEAPTLVYTVDCRRGKSRERRSELISKLPLS
jgi:hypothetical protein